MIHPIDNLMWHLEYGLLLLINGLETVLNFLCGSTIVDYFFNSTNPLASFWYMMIVIGAIFCGVFLIWLATKMYLSSKNIIIGFAQALVKIFFIFVIMGCLAFVLFFAMNFIYGLVTIIENQFNHLSLTNIIYLIGYTDKDAYMAHINDNWHMHPNFDAGYNVWVAIIGAAAGVILFIFWNNNLIKRLIDILYLWFMFPIIAFSTVADESYAKIITWKEKVLASIFLTLFVIIGLLIFYTITPIILDIAFNTFKDSSIEAYIAFVILWIICGGFACFAGIKNIVEIFGANYNYQNQIKIPHGIIAKPSKIIARAWRK